MTPIRPVSEDHRHEPADYELEPNELALRNARNALNAMMEAWFDYHDAHSLTQPVTGRAGNAFDKALAAREELDEALTALTQAPRSCCADERERAIAKLEKMEPPSRRWINRKDAIAAIRSNSHANVGSLEDGVPNHFDHTKRGFQP